MSNSPDHARRFGNALIDKALSVGAFPEMGQIVLEIGDLCGLLFRRLWHKSTLSSSCQCGKRRQPVDVAAP